jgi:hypothetical protein
MIWVVTNEKYSPEMPKIAAKLPILRRIRNLSSGEKRIVEFHSGNKAPKRVHLTIPWFSGLGSVGKPPVTATQLCRPGIACIRQRRGAMNSLGTDYLLYSLLDSVVDSYFPAMDRLNERLDLIEEEIMRGRRTGQMESIHQLRGDLLNVRRAIRPQAAPSIGANRRSSMKSTATFS